MFQHILVPLDGSARAELALPVATRLARTTGACITLLQAVTLPSDFLGQTMESPLLQEKVDADRAQAADYLRHIAASKELTGITVMTEVANGHPVHLILTLANTQSLDAPPVDLIIMCSHGATGFKRWVWGSIAQHIARHSPLPVLVLNERGNGLIHSCTVHQATEQSTVAHASDPKLSQQDIIDKTQTRYDDDREPAMMMITTTPTSAEAIVGETSQESVPSRAAIVKLLTPASLCAHSRSRPMSRPMPAYATIFSMRRRGVYIPILLSVLLREGYGSDITDRS